VLLEGEPERFPRDRLLDDQLLQRLRNVVGRIILFLIRFRRSRSSRSNGTQRMMFGSPLGQDVGDAVAHAEIRAHRAVEDALEDREHVGGGTADVHADHWILSSRAMVSMMSPTAPGWA